MTNFGCDVLPGMLRTLIRAVAPPTIKEGLLNRAVVRPRLALRPLVQVKLIYIFLGFLLRIKIAMVVTVDIPGDAIIVVVAVVVILVIIVRANRSRSGARRQVFRERQPPTLTLSYQTKAVWSSSPDQAASACRAVLVSPGALWALSAQVRLYQLTARRLVTRPIWPCGQLRRRRHIMEYWPQKRDWNFLKVTTQMREKILSP